MVNPQVGFQPRTTPAERRADLDQRRRSSSDLADAVTTIYTDPDDFTGPITVTVDETATNYTSNKTAAADFDGAIHLSIRSAGTEIGRITRATSTTAGYLTTSDEDLKQDIRPVDDELTLLWMRTTEPMLFEYKDAPGIRHVGYMAQQIAQLWPNAVLNGIVIPGWGDVDDRTWDEDGNETTPPGVWQAWMMDHAKLTPALHAGLRTLDRIIEARGVILDEQAARIDTLEQQVAALMDVVADLPTSDDLGELRVEVYYTRQMTAEWQFSNTATAPPGSGQLRINTAATTMWLHRIDTDGRDRRASMDFIVARTALHPDGMRFRIRGNTGSVLELRTNGAATVSGDYYTIPIQVISGTPTDKGFRVEITLLSEIWAENPPPLPTVLPS